MARGKVKCPRLGTALRLASGEVVKAAKLDGKVCTRAGIAVEQGGMVRRVEASQVVGRVKGIAGLGSLVPGTKDTHVEPLDLDVIKPLSPPVIVKFRVYVDASQAGLHQDGSRSSVQSVWVQHGPTVPPDNLVRGRAYVSHLKEALREHPTYVGQAGGAPRAWRVAIRPSFNEMRMLYLPEHSVQKLSVWLDQLESKGLSGLGIEWTGKQSLTWPDEGPPQDTTFNITPLVTGQYPVKGGSVLPSLDKIREALEYNDELASSDPDFDRSLVQIDGGNWWFRREDLERALAAEDYYRGIMPPETQFHGLGVVAPRSSSKASAPPSDWRVAKTELPHVVVSTVRLDDEEVEPFETMVFRRVAGRADMAMSLETQRYTSRDEAARGHKQMVLRWQTREAIPESGRHGLQARVFDASPLSGPPEEHTRIANRYQYAAHKAKGDVLATGLMATDKPNCIAAAPAIEKLNEVYGRAWAEGVHGENTTLTRERMLQLESAVSTLNEAFRRKCVRGYGAFNEEG